MKKVLWVFLVITWSLMGYGVGDTLDKTVVTKLGLEKDKLYVVDFFASWCHSCKKELPLVSQVSGNKDVNIIGVNVDSDIKKGKAFVKKLALCFDVVYDRDKTLIEKFNPSGVPALYYVKNGKILSMHIGAMKEIDKKIIKEVKKL